MSRLRKVLLPLALLLLVVHTVHSRGQIVGSASGMVVGYFAPPAIEHGLLLRFSRAPDSLEAQIRSAIRLGNSALDRVGVGGAHYVAGKLIVKFRSGTSSASKVSARSVAAASTSTEPPYANFEVMTIDPATDAEAAARALSDFSGVPSCSHRCWR